MPNELPMQDIEPPKKRRVKLIIILVLMLVFIGTAAGAIWVYFLDGSMPAIFDFSTTAESTTSSTATGENRPQPIGNVVPLSAFTVNLADPLGRRLLTINLSLEVTDPSMVEELKKHDPRVRDTIIMLLSSKTFGDVSSNDSKIILKSEITSRVNQLLGGQKVVQTFITDMLVR